MGLKKRGARWKALWESDESPGKTAAILAYLVYRMLSDYEMRDTARICRADRNRYLPGHEVLRRLSRDRLSVDVLIHK